MRSQNYPSSNCDLLFPHITTEERAERIAARLRELGEDPENFQTVYCV
jgi:hypothetical protein